MIILAFVVIIYIFNVVWRYALRSIIKPLYNTHSLIPPFKSSVRSVSRSLFIVSWSYESGTQRVLSGCRTSCGHTRCKHALTTIELRCDQSLPTKADLPPINLGCTPAFPDPYKTRFGLLPHEQWGCAGESTHKYSLKVSLGLWQWRNLGLRWDVGVRPDINCIRM